MRYLPHTQDDIKEMLEVVGAKSLDDLFNCQIPANSRRDTPLDLPEAMTEWALTERLEQMAQKGGGDWQVYFGAGSQPHHIPVLVPYLANRSEFLTSYTPYQPELTQGNLQAIFEFQTLISRLVGLPITNASMYEGSTSMAEAALMAQRITKRSTVVVSSLIHPHWREVLKTYMDPLDDVKIITLPADKEGKTDLSKLNEIDSPAVLLMQSPNFLGVIEELPKAAEAIHAAGGLLASGFSEAFALGMIKTPGESGADIVFGEAQSLGLAQGFGGPTLGVLSTKKEFIRQMPGRLVGLTKDIEGKPGFVLTLSTREQHIRRGKAVSNICSNTAHCALTAAIFMASIGGTGFRQTAQLNLDLAEYLKKGLTNLGFKPLSQATTFNEFAMIAPEHFDQVYKKLQEKNILAGLAIESWYPEYKNVWLFGATETKTKKDIDTLLNEVKNGQH